MGRTEGTNSNSTPYVMTNAYAVVPDASDDVEMRLHSVQVDQPALNRSDFQHIPEACDLTWQDDFFEDESDVVADFDLDYDKMELSSKKSAGCSTMPGATALIPGCFLFFTFVGTPCYIRRNVQRAVRSQHVAITRAGVRFVAERRPYFWGTPCSDTVTTVSLRNV